MHSEIGWFGMAEEIMNYLNVVQADKDGAGSFIIAGAPITNGLDPQECVVSGATVYFVNGKQFPLAANMPESRGLKVRVF